jgi:hypothetical protein
VIDGVAHAPTHIAHLQIDAARSTPQFQFGQCRIEQSVAFVHEVCALAQCVLSLVHFTMKCAAEKDAHDIRSIELCVERVCT